MSLKSAESQLNQLKDTYNELGQYSRRDCIQIQGIPEQRLEDTNESVKKVGKLIHVSVTDTDICIIHHLPSKHRRGSSNDYPIIVKFVQQDSKETYYQARKKLKHDLDFC